MEKETPKDKLLKACGVPGKPGPDREGKKRPEAIPGQAETAPAWAQLAQDETSKNYRRLQAYLRDELPSHLVKAIEDEAQNSIVRSLGPLEDSVCKAACRIDNCSADLVGISWNGRVIWFAVLIGLCTVSLGACLVPWTIIEGKFDEARRYELYGRKVEANIERYKPKDQEKLYKWVGGRP
jgi:hypothetical protein